MNKLKHKHEHQYTHKHNRNTNKNDHEHKYEHKRRHQKHIQTYFLYSQHACLRVLDSRYLSPPELKFDSPGQISDQTATIQPLQSQQAARPADQGKQSHQIL